METIAMWFEINDKNLHAVLREAEEKLESVQGELVLDFSSLLRMDPCSLRAMEEFSSLAAAKGVKVALRGVNVGVYLVLKLVKLTSRFSFVN
jgi:anti-anti-sigma regulatory factor